MGLSKNNFDAFRLFLALVVVSAHFFELTGLPEPKASSLFILNPAVAVGCFFVVSGYLIVGSFVRASALGHYVAARILRVAPLYYFVVTVAFVIAAFATPIPFQEFIGGGMKFLAANYTFLNFLQPELPGIFSNNPYSPTVNGSLWTIKIEVAFYIFVPIIFTSITSNRNRIIACVALYFLSVCFYFLISSVVASIGFGEQLKYQFPTYLCYFMAGAIFNFVQVGRWLVNAGFCFSILFFGLVDQPGRGVDFIIPVITSFFVVKVCLFSPFHLSVPSVLGDLSYGAYVWHFPVIQTSIALGVITRPFDLIWVIGVVLLLAFLSWHLIERVMIARRDQFASYMRGAKRGASLESRI